MQEFKIILNGIDKVKVFINIVSKYPFDIEIISGRYIIDAKSIMGIFSLDITKSVRLCINSEDRNAIYKLEKELRKINVIVDEEE